MAGKDVWAGSIIYGTMGGPWKPGESMATTRKGDRIYIHLFKFTGDKAELPCPVDLKIKSCRIMNGPAVKFRYAGEKLIVDLAGKELKNGVTTLEITLSGDALKLETMN